MRLTQGYQAGIIVAESFVTSLQAPVDSVDGVGTAVAVVHAFLIAHELLAVPDERQSLRGEHDGLREHIEAHEFVIVNHLTAERTNAGTQTVGKHHIVVAGHISNELRGLERPGLIAVINLREVDTRMVDAADNAEAYRLLAAGQTGEERSLMVVVERSAQSVTHLVAERTDAGHLQAVGFDGTQRLVKLRRLGCPALAVEENGRVNLVEHRTDSVHRLDVMDSHQVETEAVEVILLHPPAYGLEHELAHHRSLAGRLVAAAGRIAQTTILAGTVEVAGSGLGEISMCYVVGVIVHDIQYDAYARLVQGLNHLLELAYAAHRVVRVGGVTALGHVVVNRVVAPVVAIIRQARLINRAVVVGRQQLHMRHAQFAEMVDTRSHAFRRKRSVLGEGEELTPVGHARRRMDRIVTMMELVDDSISLTLHGGTAVSAPPFGVGVAHINNSTTTSVDAHRHGEDARRLLLLIGVGRVEDEEGVEPSLQVALDSALPRTILLTLQPLRAERLDGFGGLVQTEPYGISVGTPKGEQGLRGGVCHLTYTAGLDRIVVNRLVVRLADLAADKGYSCHNGEEFFHTISCCIDSIRHLPCYCGYGLRGR